MNRKPHGKRRAPGRRRFPVRPWLEVLEARLVLSAAPTAPVVNQSAFLAVPVFVPPAGLTPANPGTVLSANPAPPPGDEVFLEALLHLGGGHAQELLHFPPSGGGNQEKPPEPPAGAPASTGLESEVFAGDFWSEPVLSPEDTAIMMAHTSEALAD